jgi:hypothetical protein
MPILIGRLTALSARLSAYAERFELLQDSRAFATTYALITKIIARELPKRKWNDPNFVVGLAEAFSGRYLAALDAYDLGQSPGPAWANVFKVTASTRTSVLEDLICAMAAHIMHDLPIALTEIRFQQSAPNEYVADFNEMNDVLGSGINEIFDTLTRRYNPTLRWLELLGWRNEEILTDYGIALSRAAAWYNACRLLSSDATSAAASIVRSPAILIHDLLHPPFFSADLLLRAFRWVAALGRRWPMPAAPPNPLPVQDAPNREYYFHIGAGMWRGTFTFKLTSFSALMREKMPLKQRILGLIIAGIMGVLRAAPIYSRIHAFPDQNAAGVAFNIIRIAFLGLTLYVSREVYALLPDGHGVFVETKQRFGPLPFLLNFRTRYPATVEGDGHHTRYEIPLLATTWSGDYQVAIDEHHIDSRVSCDWAIAEEHIEKLN